MSLRGAFGGGGGRGSGQGQGGGRGRGGGSGLGQGRGGGRGMGRGTNRGRGGGRGMGMEAPPNPVERPDFQPHAEQPGPGGLGSENPDQEIAMLRVQADTMLDQLQAINARISILQGEKVPAPVDIADKRVRRKTSNNTGYGKVTAIVNKEECVSCGACAIVCPEEAITMNDIAVVDPQKCTGCGLCIDECPNMAISLAELKEVAS